MKDVLFILKAPFIDGDQRWYCNDCATLEGALLANPHWNDKYAILKDIREIGWVLATRHGGVGPHP